MPTDMNSSHGTGHPRNVNVRFIPKGDFFLKRSTTQPQTISVSRVSNHERVEQLLMKVFPMFEVQTFVMHIDDSMITLEDIVQECQAFIASGIQPWFPITRIGDKAQVDVQASIAT